MSAIVNTILLDQGLNNVFQTVDGTDAIDPTAGTYTPDCSASACLGDGMFLVAWMREPNAESVDPITYYPSGNLTVVRLMDGEFTTLDEITLEGWGEPLLAATDGNRALLVHMDNEGGDDLNAWILDCSSGKIVVTTHATYDRTLTGRWASLHIGKIDTPFQAYAWNHGSVVFADELGIYEFSATTAELIAYQEIVGATPSPYGVQIMGLQVDGSGAVLIHVLESGEDVNVAYAMRTSTIDGLGTGTLSLTSMTKRNVPNDITNDTWPFACPDGRFFSWQGPWSEVGPGLRHVVDLDTGTRYTFDATPMFPQQEFSCAIAGPYLLMLCQAYYGTDNGSSSAKDTSHGYVTEWTNVLQVFDTNARTLSVIDLDAPGHIELPHPWAEVDDAIFGTLSLAVDKTGEFALVGAGLLSAVTDPASPQIWDGPPFGGNNSVCTVVAWKISLPEVVTIEELGGRTRFYGRR